MSSELYIPLNYLQSSFFPKGFFASDTKLSYFDFFWGGGLGNFKVACFYFFELQN